MNKIIFKDSFYLTIQEIYFYIKEESPQNANKFKTEIKKQIEKIKKNPNSYPIIDLKDFENKEDNFHYSHFYKTFKVIYKIEKEAIVFLGVLHDRRDSKVIQDLMP